MNRQEFEELALQVQQSNLPLKSYLQQIGVSYSTYHYWRKKCSVERNSIKQELAPISFKQAVTESSQEEQFPHGVALLFHNGLRAHTSCVQAGQICVKVSVRCAEWYMRK